MKRTVSVMSLALVLVGCGGGDATSAETEPTSTPSTEARPSTTLDPDVAATEWLGSDGVEAVSDWLAADQAAKDGPFLDDITNEALFPDFASDVGAIASAARRVRIASEDASDPPAVHRTDLLAFLDSMEDVEEAADDLSRCLSLVACDDEFASFTSVSRRAYEAVDELTFIQEAIAEQS